MRFLPGSIRSGSVWTLSFFILSFARTLMLTPLMLTHWGKEVFCFWALIISARALICFLPDSFIRYAGNEYNILYHHNKEDAGRLLRSALSFLGLCLAGMCLLLVPLLLFCRPLLGFIFDVPDAAVSTYGLGESLLACILASGMQLLQRLYATVKEALGLIWQNLLLETLLLAVQTLVLSVLIFRGFSFRFCMLADSAVLLLGVLLYMRQLSGYLPGALRWNRAALSEGRALFVRARRLYAGNFLDKASSDGLLLLLSFFRFDKTVIAVFATVKTLVNAPLLAGNLLLNAWTPELQRRYTLRNNQGLQDLLRLARAGMAALLFTGIVCAYPFYKPLFLFWTRDRLFYNDWFVALMLIAAVCNLYGLGYGFVLKGINAQQRFLLLMLLKTGITLAVLIFMTPSLYTAAFSWLLAELLVSLVLLPLLHARQLREDGFEAAFSTDMIYSLPCLSSVLTLACFAAYGFSIPVLLGYLLAMALLTAARFRGRIPGI